MCYSLVPLEEDIEDGAEVDMVVPVVPVVMVLQEVQAMETWQLHLPVVVVVGHIKSVFQKLIIYLYKIKVIL